MNVDHDLEALQKNILYIAVYFDKFCREHDIQYFLLGGTALGAARHGGFIPWDDDFDVCMTHENYDKFKEKCHLFLDKKLFYFQQGDTKEWPLYFSKIRMNNTLYLEEDVRGRDMHHGIYIDIMCLNNTFSNKYLRYSQFLCARILSASALGRRGFITDSKLKRIVTSCAAFLMVKPLRNVLMAYVQVLNRKANRTNLVSHFFGRAKFKNTCFRSDWLGNRRDVSFENNSFQVMEHYERYLESRFGSQYMELPSEETKAQYPSHCVEYVLADSSITDR